MGIYNGKLLDKLDKAASTRRYVVKARRYKNMAISRIENESVVVRGKNQYARAELLNLYDPETFILETGKTPLLWYPVTRGEMFVSWLQKGHAYTIDQLMRVLEVMLSTNADNEVVYQSWLLFYRLCLSHADVLTMRKEARGLQKEEKGTEIGECCKQFLALTRYFGNGRGVLCNECYSVLNVEELSRYPLQWQYSGDMYCGRHETRPQFFL